MRYGRDFGFWNQDQQRPGGWRTYRAEPYGDRFAGARRWGYGAEYAPGGARGRGGTYSRGDFGGYGAGSRGYQGGEDFGRGYGGRSGGGFGEGLDQYYSGTFHDRGPIGRSSNQDDMVYGPGQGGRGESRFRRGFRR